MVLSLIYAVAANGVIGKDNQLPWHLSEDMKYFKRMTMGKPIIMGRKTFESIGRPLPKRENLVVTRNSQWQRDGVSAFGDLESAINSVADHPEVMIIGGSELFAWARPMADRLYVTEIHRAFDGDCFMSMPDRSVWREIAREDYDGEMPYSFVTYQHG